MPFGIKWSEAVELVKQGATVEAQIKLVELQNEMLTIERENLSLQRRVAELEGELTLREKLTFESPYYWLGTDNRREGPFCQACRDRDGKLVRLQSNHPGDWHCTVCKNGYRDQSWRPFDMIPGRD